MELNKGGGTLRDTIFRLNDIRGEIDKDMTVDDMALIAQALVVYVCERGFTNTTVIIGRDGRLHSAAIVERVIRVFEHAQFKVIDIGICATPVVQFTMLKMPADLAIMVTASHNGPTYNGFKIFYKQKSLCGKSLQELRNLVGALSPGDTKGFLPAVALTGMSQQVARYITWLHDNFLHLKGWQGKIVFDCGSGATGVIVPLLIKKMEWSQAEVLYEELDGRFPFHEADPVVADNMRDLAQHVVNAKALCGIGFDGDGDRMGIVTSTGCHVRGDRLLALFSRYVLKKSPGQAIVFDSKCSQMVHNVITQEGGTPHCSPSGHSLIRKHMDEQGAVFGGELSCHFFFADDYFGYDDAVYAALRFIDMLHISGSSVEDLLKLLPPSYSSEEWRIPYADDKKWDIMRTLVHDAYQHPQTREISLLDGVRIITPYGWILLRASQTQPALCLCSESYSLDAIKPLGDIIKDLLQKYDVWLSMEHAFDEWLETMRLQDRPLV